MKCKSLFFFLFVLQFVNAQIFVSTISDEFNASGGIKLGPDGYLYIANFGQALNQGTGSEVWRLKPGEAPELFASGLVGASGNDFDSQGNLFQSNIGASKISKITPDGTVTDFTSTGIVNPVGIAIDAEDNLYVCNCGNNTIRKVSPDGVSTPFAGGSLFDCPNGITIDEEGNLFVSNFGDSNVIKITPDGTPGFFAAIPGNNNGHLTYFAQGNIFYVNSHGSSRIYRMTPEGDVSVFAGSGQRGNQDGMGQNATFSRPNGIAVAPSGDTLFVNSSIPTVDNPPANFFPLNPSVVRMVRVITGTSSLLVEKGWLKAAPNPADNAVKIRLFLPEAMPVSLRVYNNEGKVIRTIVEKLTEQGEHEFVLPAETFSAGVYHLVLMGEQGSLNRKLVVR